MKNRRGALTILAVLLAARASFAVPGDPAPKSGAAVWGAEYFPNTPLVSHEGRNLRFFDDLIQDKVVVVNFIYTSCPDACPLETAKLTEVQALLGDRVGQDVFLYSISIDPERDTPEVLREYAERFQTGPGWLFLTGQADDIRLLRQKLGLLGREGDTKLSDHTLNLLIGNQATGQWMKRSAMENPHLLATQIGSWLSNWSLPPEPGLDYADAPELRSITRGESLFRTRCSSCHAIGAEDGLVRQGPDLLGVTERRERAWLARWLAEPDAMLAERDPIALELFAAYRNLPMPNMRLNQIEVQALIEFMSEESKWYVESTASEPEEATVVADEKPSCCQKDEGLVLGGSAEGADAPAPSAIPALAGPELEPVPMAATPAQVGPTRRSPGLPTTALLLCAGLGMALGCLGFLLGRGASKG